MTYGLHAQCDVERVCLTTTVSSGDLIDQTFTQGWMVAKGL